MAEARTAITPATESFSQKICRYYNENAGASPIAEPEWQWEWSKIEKLAQDQVIIKIAKGSSINTYRGLHIGTEIDSQSDRTGAIPVQFRHIETKSLIGMVVQEINRLRESEYGSKFEESFEPVVATVQAVEVEADTTDDVSRLTSSQLTSAILDTQAESDMPNLRDMIFIAEDTSFSVEESEKLAPWLLAFAEKHRNSSDPQDESPVWSAIRTGASMLRPDVANCLCPLLEPGHSIETSMVAVKMLGRIFEAQPPAAVDEHQALANEILPMANSLLNRYAIASSQNAAMAQLAIYALAAMASSKIDDVVEKVQELNVSWFTQQTLYELDELASIWANRTVPIADPPQKLLDSVIQTIGEE